MNNKNHKVLLNDIRLYIADLQKFVNYLKDDCSIQNSYSEQKDIDEWECRHLAQCNNARRILTDLNYWRYHAIRYISSKAEKQIDQQGIEGEKS